MKDFYIDMKNVDMYYPSQTYNVRSIKEDFFSLIKGNSKRVLLKDVYALKEFNLHISEGERLGVIGHNGAGKSTLLKTIAGIFPVEKGSVEVSGKIRALFDISLGFDMESTGRENILYRGLLLGASPAEMREKEGEIIEFAGLGDFIDYPVKAYSTGMAVRLAFAISTCIDGEILLLDEILGAGDATFIDKANRRIIELIDNARLMVFVTHNLEAMKDICNRAIVLNQGRIVFDGKPEDAIKEYSRITV